MSSDETTQTVAQLSSLAKQIQESSSFQSAKLAEQMAGLAEEIRKGHQNLAGLTPERPLAAVQHGVEEIQRAISAMQVPGASVAEQVTRALHQIQEQQGQALQRATEEMQRAIESAAKAPGATAAEQMTIVLQRLEAQQEQALRTQQDLFKSLTDNLTESMRRLDKASGET